MSVSRCGSLSVVTKVGLELSGRRYVSSNSSAFLLDAKMHFILYVRRIDPIVFAFDVYTTDRKSFPLYSFVGKAPSARRFR